MVSINKWPSKGPKQVSSKGNLTGHDQAPSGGFPQQAPGEKVALGRVDGLPLGFGRDLFF